MPKRRRVDLTPSEPRVPPLRHPRDLPVSEERLSEQITPAVHDYSISLADRIRIGVSVLLRGEPLRGLGVIVGTSEPSPTDAERTDMLEGFKSWRTTFLGILTGVSTVVAALLGKGIGEGLVETIATILAVITSLVLIFIKPEEKPSPTNPPL